MSETSEAERANLTHIAKWEGSAWKRLGGRMNEIPKGYLIIKMLGGLNKNIDSKNALLIAKSLFDIEDKDLAKMRIYEAGLYARKFVVYIESASGGWWFDRLKIALNVYAIEDGLYLYYAYFGYDPKNNIVVYAKEIGVEKI